MVQKEPARCRRLILSWSKCIARPFHVKSRPATWMQGSSYRNEEPTIASGTVDDEVPRPSGPDGTTPGFILKAVPNSDIFPTVGPVPGQGPDSLPERGPPEFSCVTASEVALKSCCSEMMPGRLLSDQARVARTMLNGVSVAFRTLPNPPSIMVDDNLAKPACAPNAAPAGRSNDVPPINTLCNSNDGAERLPR